ncbi:Hypothetical predicted protein [Pelobates cultripes]|uniref:Uncharacterized protein n=1 Tax=Pelobates cultripes TaxID=61616 RepID=A0AAD1RU20_PELCU|nr:Hypothetical predicted protein [Pelobates cultripes]
MTNKVKMSHSKARKNQDKSEKVTFLPKNGPRLPVPQTKACKMAPKAPDGAARLPEAEPLTTSFIQKALDQQSSKLIAI